MITTKIAKLPNLIICLFGWKEQSNQRVLHYKRVGKFDSNTKSNTKRFFLNLTYLASCDLKTHI